MICLPKNKINDNLHRFNNIHPNLVFTKEISINNSINFLDINLKFKIIKLSQTGTENQFGLDAI